MNWNRYGAEDTEQGETSSSRDAHNTPSAASSFNLDASRQSCEWAGVDEAPVSNFNPSLVDLVDPHAVANESVVEHSFGITKTRGQGNLQTAEEYINSKQKVQVNFMLKMSKLNFNQHCMSRHDAEKSYQDVEEQNKNHKNENQTKI